MKNLNIYDGVPVITGPVTRADFPVDAELCQDADVRGAFCYYVNAYFREEGKQDLRRETVADHCSRQTADAVLARLQDIIRGADRLCTLLVESPQPDPTATPSINAVLADPSTSFWLKRALASSVNRDALDAARDAELLHRLLDARLESEGGAV